MRAGTSFEGGAICYNIPYYRDYPLNESIEAWQYVDRLTGWYHEKFGIVLAIENTQGVSAGGVGVASATVSRIVNTCLVIVATRDWYTAGGRNSKTPVRTPNRGLGMRDGGGARAARRMIGAFASVVTNREAAVARFLRGRSL